MRNTFFSKLLLFGEHTVNLGSQALAIPLPLFSGSWKPYGKQYDLLDFVTYLEQLHVEKIAILDIDTEQFRQSIDEGWALESNVPKGYGAGSSGLLCAAVYERFGKDKLSPNFLNFDKLKKGFAQMEGFFHGKSSGLDPLICYSNEPLLITSAGVTTVTLPMYIAPNNAIFLLDTKQSRKAEPLIDWFLKSAQNTDFQNSIKNDLVPKNNEAIAAFLEGHWSNLMKATHTISAFQLAHLSPMIPQNYENVWKIGLESDFFKIKICGAGGGGFLLGVTSDIAKVENLLGPDYAILRVQI
jgi:mevalonate kinase